MKTIKDLHELGLSGICKGYPLKKWITSVPFFLSIVSAIFVTTTYAFLSNNPKFITQLIDLMVTILPNLLGFGLGGFAILISFSSIFLSRLITNQLENPSNTLYQITSSIFAFTLILQAFSLLAALFLKLIIAITGEGILNCCYDIQLVFILSFMLIWSVTVLIDLIKNIFNFSQVYHFTTYMDALKSKESKPKTTTE